MPVASTQTTKQLGQDSQSASGSSTNTSTQAATSTRDSTEGAQVSTAKSTKKAVKSIQTTEAEEATQSQGQHAAVVLQFSLKLNAGVGTNRYTL